MPDQIRVARLDELPWDTGFVIEAGGQEIALFRIGAAEVCAIENVCPHREGPIGDGALDGEIVTCPIHAWDVNVRTGEVVDFPDMSTPTIPCHVVNGEVFVEI